MKTNRENERNCCLDLTAQAVPGEGRAGLVLSS